MKWLKFVSSFKQSWILWIKICVMRENFPNLLTRGQIFRKCMLWKYFFLCMIKRKTEFDSWKNFSDCFVRFQCTSCKNRQSQNHKIGGARLQQFFIWGDHENTKHTILFAPLKVLSELVTLEGWKCSWA